MQAPYQGPAFGHGRYSAYLPSTPASAAYWWIQANSVTAASALTAQVIQIDRNWLNGGNLPRPRPRQEGPRAAMHALEALIYLSGAYPVARAWLSNRGTTMVHALSWTAAAWLAWFGALLLEDKEGAAPAGYLALCLTGCAGTAVLGARRPIAGAWNFVLLALLGVLLLPLAENAVLSTPLLDPLRLLFICATVALGVLNYLPTRFCLAAVAVGAACLGELFLLMGMPADEARGSLLTHVIHWLLAAACWLAMIAVRRNWTGVAVLDREWLTFRDRFGLMWGQRVREQFNRAAANAGWAVQLRWRGLRKTARDAVLPPADQAAIVTMLRGILKRFGPAGDQ
jgi:hypothetical protein